MIDVARKAVFVEKVGEHVALVTLNRPQARNAINSELARELAGIVAQIEGDAQIRAAIVTGAGEQAFCAGADLKEVDAGGMSDLFLDDGGFAGFVDAPRTKPWIAAVNGFALAGGCEIALACDMIVAARSAHFGIPEVGRGLIAAAGGAYRLARRIPRNIATGLAVTGRMISAVEAARWGMVNCVSDDDGLMDAAIALAQKIASNAPCAVAESLMIVKASVDYDENMLGVMSRDALARLATTDDYSEGPRAFIEKREPCWKGC